YTFMLSIFKPEWVPAVPKEARTLQGWELWKTCLMGIIPSGVLIFVVLGTMMLGLATPTEAGAMGAVGAIVLAVIRHPQLGQSGRIAFIAGLVAVAIGLAIGWVAFKSLPFKLAFAVLYIAVAWLC